MDSKHTFYTVLRFRGPHALDLDNPDDLRKAQEVVLRLEKRIRLCAWLATQELDIFVYNCPNFPSWISPSPKDDRARRTFQNALGHLKQLVGLLEATPKASKGSVSDPVLIDALDEVEFPPLRRDKQ